MHLGDRISKALVARGHKPKALQKHLGWAQPSMSRLLNGVQRGTIEMQKIADFLDVPVHWLTSGEDTPVPDPTVSEAESRVIRGLREEVRTMADALKILEARVQQLEKTKRGRSSKERTDAVIPTDDLVRAADLIDPASSGETKPGARTGNE